MKINDMTEKSAVVDNDKIEISNSAATNDSEITRRISFSTLWNWIKSKCGNASGDVPISNGAICTNLNAEMVGGFKNADLVRQYKENISFPIGNDYKTIAYIVAPYISSNILLKIFGTTDNCVVDTFSLILSNHPSSVYIETKSGTYTQIGIKLNVGSTGAFYLSVKIPLEYEGSFVFTIIVNNGEEITFYPDGTTISAGYEAVLENNTIAQETVISKINWGATPVNNIKQWTSNNDGIGSGLDADLIRGISGSLLTYMRGEVVSDWNDYTENGTYFVVPASFNYANNPNIFGAGLLYPWGVLVVQKYTNGGIVQIYYPHSGTSADAAGKIMIRTGWEGSTWYPWRELPQCNGLLQTNLNSNFLEGLHASEIFEHKGVYDGDLDNVTNSSDLYIHSNCSNKPDENVNWGPH